ncbi:MAG: hypothetical protein EOP04_05035 [Proteobacteria bacterium]|nr:MAG: hypothetical protein EOP04_05035 [Pseudomonadota bacterium]
MAVLEALDPFHDRFLHLLLADPRSPVYQFLHDCCVERLSTAVILAISLSAQTLNNLKYIENSSEFMARILDTLI